MSKILHIVNGDDLAKNLDALDIPGDRVIWREMLCEGPTIYELGSEKFIKVRSRFLENTYGIPPKEYEEKFIEELHKLTITNSHDEIVLWFEFDLFSHINMMAVISHLLENRKDVPVSLVCSKRLKGEKEFSPLSQLPLKHLSNHYEQRIPLNDDDLEMAGLIWQLYNGDNPQKLKTLIKKETNFEYLSSCVRAHIERFPHAKTGLNTLERNILKLIEKNNITSIRHLIGYTLEYQGYFGLGDLQLERIIDNLKLFYQVKEDKVELSPQGKEALTGTRNFYRELKNDECMGGVKKYDFLYDEDSHKILKL